MMRKLLPLLLLAFVTTTLFVACSSDPPDPNEDAGTPVGACKLPYVGDPNAEMEMEVISLGALGKTSTITDGSNVTLMFPPQGGRVVFAGVRARNVNPCAVRISGALRDSVSQQVRIDSRIINLEVTADGWARSSPTDHSTFTNIAVCPNSWSTQDLMDVPYELTISLTDKDFRKVTRILQVTPRCNEPLLEDACICQCDSEYVLGMACGGLPTDGDAGVHDASTDAGE